MKKRIFARALALFMALSLLSTTAFADVSFSEFQTAIDKGESIYQEGYTSESEATGADKYKVEVNTTGDGQRDVKLWDDVVYAGSENKDYSKTIEICGDDRRAQNVTIDLNGHKIDGGNNDPETPSTGRNVFSVWNNATNPTPVSLTVKDTSEGASGKITGGHRTDGTGSAVDVKNATFNFESGNITGNVGGPAVQVASVRNGGKAEFNMSGGNITGNKDTVGEHGSVYILDALNDNDTGSVNVHITGGNIFDNENIGDVAIQINSNLSKSSTISGDGNYGTVSIQKGTVTVGEGDDAYTLSIDENSNITITDSAGNSVDAVLDEDDNRISAGVLAEGTSLKFVGELSPVPVVPGEGSDPDTIPDSDVIGVIDFTTAGAGTSGTTISDNEIPLAGLISVAQLLNYLHEHDGIADAELPEDFQWADHEYAQAIYWGLQEELVIDTEDDTLDPDEILTVVVLREIMTNYAEYLGTTFDVVIEDEDDMIVMNCDEILAEFYASLEDLAA